MKIGILETGQPPPILIPRFGDYVSMIRRLLGEAHAYAAYRVTEGGMPDVEDAKPMSSRGRPAVCMKVGRGSASSKRFYVRHEVEFC